MFMRNRLENGVTDQAAPAPKISVIIPLYNYEEYIAECITSLKRQTFDDFEVIIVDDASSDHSPAIAEQMTNDDPRFSVLRNATNKGLPATRNVGLRASRGVYILHLDADDFFAPHALERLASASETGRDDIIGFGYTFYSGPKQANVAVEPQIDRASTQFLAETKLWDFNSVCRYMYARSFIIMNALEFDEDVQLGEDQIYLSKVLPRARSISLISGPLIYYRVGHRSMSTFTGNWPWKEDCGLWPLAVAKNIRRWPEVYNFTFLRSFHRYAEKLATMREIVPASEAQEIVGLFCEAYGELDLALASDPSLQPWRNKIYVPQHYLALLSAIKRGDRTAINQHLSRIAARYADAGIHESRDLNHARLFQQSMRVLRAAHAAKPSHAGIKAQLAETLSHLAKFDEAEFLVRQAIRRAPEVCEYHEILSRLQLRRSAYGDAIETLRSACALDPQNTKLLVLKGHAELGLGNAEAARKSCDLAGAVAKDATEALILRSKVEAARSRPIRAQQCAMVAVKRSPFCTDAHVCLAKRHLAAGDHESAIARLRDTLGFTARPGAVQMTLSHVLSQAGDFNGALDAAKRAIAHDSDVPDWHLLLANRQLQSGDWQQAVICAQRAVKLMPNNADAYKMLSIALMRSGRLDQALAAITKAISIDGAVPEWHVHRANLQLQCADWNGASQSASQAVALSEDYAPAYRTLGAAFIKLGRFNAAIEAVKRAISLRGNVAEWHVCLTGLLIRQQDWIAATESVWQAINLAPGNAKAYRALSTVMANVGKLDDAEAAVRKAIELKDDVPEWHQYLAALLKQKEAWERMTTPNGRRNTKAPRVPSVSVQACASKPHAEPDALQEDFEPVVVHFEDVPDVDHWRDVLQ